MSLSHEEIATRLLEAALASAHPPVAGTGTDAGKKIGDAFTAILQSVKEARSAK